MARFGAETIYLAFDSDDAGLKAALSAIALIEPYMASTEMQVKVLIVPDGKDPDDFIRENGTETYNKARGAAEPFLAFALRTAAKDRNLHNAKQKAAAIEEFLPVITAIRNNIQKRESFDQAMTFFHVEDPGLKRELWRSVEGTHGTMPTAVAQRVSRAARAKITFAERHLLELLVHDGDLRDVIIPTLEHSDYEDLATAELFDAFIAIHEAKQPVVAETLVEHLGGDEETLDLAHKLLSAEPKRAREDAMDEVLIEAENCVFTLRNMAIANRITELSREATLAEHSGNTERFNTLVYEQLKLEKIRRELQQRTG